jgi:SOS response regulatory protein OraA/RecX
LEKRKSKYLGLDPMQARKKMGAFLLRRGFPWETVQDAVEGILTEMERDTP